MWRSSEKPWEDSSEGVCSVGGGAPAAPKIYNLLLPDVNTQLGTLLTAGAAETQLLVSKITILCHSLKVLLENVFDALVARSNIALDYNFWASLSHLSAGIYKDIFEEVIIGQFWTYLFWALSSHTWAVTGHWQKWWIGHDKSWQDISRSLAFCYLTNRFQLFVSCHWIARLAILLAPKTEVELQAVKTAWIYEDMFEELSDWTFLDTSKAL